jgi:CubicO group peptidase (beta-lactamase class C family)
MTSLIFGSPETVGLDPKRIELLRQRIPEWIDGHRMRSGVLLAARRGTIVFHEAYGPLTDQPDSPLMEKDTIFSVASITKTVTAAAAMVLVERGLLGLNRPIKEYLPEVCGEGTDDVEVQHLFTHTSGFESEESERIYTDKLKEIAGESGDFEALLYQDRDIYFDCLWGLKVNTRPGTRMNYCDHNFDLLSKIIARISGEPLSQFAQREIFEPLGMKDTSYRWQDAKMHRYVRRLTPMKSFNAEWGSSLMRTTAKDLAAFGQMMLNRGTYGDRRIFSPATVHEMTRNQIPGVGTEFLGWHDEASWGLGWSVQANERWRWSAGTLIPEGTFGHLGYGGSAYWIDPINEIVGIHLTVCFDIDDESGEHHFNLDLFQNMVTAAVSD